MSFEKFVPRLGASCTHKKKSILAAGGLFLSAVIGGRAADLPALNSPASSESLVGKFEWADLFASNAAKEGDFYAKLFAWTATATEQNHHKVVLLSQGERPVASIVERAVAKKNSVPARWIGYAAVADLPAALSVVEKSGGKILAKVRDVPQRGMQAIVADREGAVFGLLRSGTGDLPDFQPMAGELAWAELFSPAPKAATELYQKVFNYEAVVDSGHEGGNHFLLATGEFARAGVAPSPPWKDGKADWLIFFCVADAGVTASKATELGGSVVVAPHVSPHGGKIAILSDPEGGLVGVIELEAATALKEAP